MREVAVVDRIVDGVTAVLIVGDPPERELAIARDALPAQVREGHWLAIELEGDRLVSAEIDEQATENARKGVRAKLDELRRRGRRLS